ncbi:MAG TPA: CFI-box-CTERM domain-containing protein [Candidatus Bathyarchaeia archaeon]|nr:CFI-box-CTERM domain-containing protein [Candidatus Bathyarchaeia archaeon]
MRVSTRKRDLSRSFQILLISILILYPGSTLTPRAQILQPILPAQAATVSPSYSLNEWNVPTPGAGPWGMTIDGQGKIWFTENATNKIARFDPTNNNFTEWSIPGGGNPRYVFTQQFIFGGKNVTRVYFTEYSSNKIAYFNSWNGTFREWQLPAGSNPVGIYVESNSTGPTDGNYRIWFTESGRDVIGLLSPATNQLTEWTLPGATSTPGTPLLEPWGIYVQTILSGIYHNETDRYVYFTEAANNAVGRLQVRTPQNLLILWDLNSLEIIPGLKYGPMDIFVDSTNPGNVIFSASAGDRISVLQNCGSTCNGYAEYVLPSRNSIAKPTSVKIDPSHSVMWFTEYNSGVVAELDSTNLGAPSFVPKSSQCLIPPTIGPACAAPSGYSVTTVTPTVTNNVLGVSANGISQPTTINLFQGPINGIAEYRLPSIVSRPNFVSIDSGGNVWFTENNVTVNKIGRISPPYDFQLSASPNTQTIQQGQSTSFSILVSLNTGIPSPVQLSVNNPQGIGASFNPPVGTPQSGTPFSSTLTLSTTNSTSPGTYPMNVTGTSAGQTRTYQISIAVNGPPPPLSFDYTIDVTNASTVSIQQGLQASFQLQVTPNAGLPIQAVNLAVNGLPAGITVTQFANFNGYPPFSSVLTLQTSITTPPGSYDLTNLITGQSTGGLQHHPKEAVTLIITELPRDFTMTVSSSAVNVVQASRADLTVAISPVGPFVSNVSLTGAFSPSDPGLTVTFSPSTLSLLPNGGTAQATMEIIAQRTTPGRTYQLIVTASSSSPSRSHQVTLSVRVSPCLIATATFGSELAPEVQFLRDFRDQQVLPTFAGFTFMSLFNSWYYSFSPNVAEYETTHTLSREVMRVLLYPLIVILQLSSNVYSILEFQPELGVLAGGVLASLLIGFTYLSLPLMGLFLICRRRLNSKVKRRAGRWIAIVIISLIACYGISEMGQLSFMMMFVSSGIVIASMLAGGMLATSMAIKLARRLC